MPPFGFSLSPEAVLYFHDALSCMAKFSEIVSFEALPYKLTLSALNLNESAYAAFSFDKNLFFSTYQFDLPRSLTSSRGQDNRPRFTCQMYNKALLSVFKGQLRDFRDPKSGLERCECHVQEHPDMIECRFIIRMVCRHGVTKTYKLTYEDGEIKRALFNQNVAKNVWKINALTLKSFIEYFAANTDQLKITTEGGRTIFTSYSEKIMKGKEILKRPMQTSVTVDNLDFERFEVEENAEIGIVLKDFKSITSHAEDLKSSVTAQFSSPGRPMRFQYSERGMICEFTLMTIGDVRGASATPAPTDPVRTSMPPPPRPPQELSRAKSAVLADEQAHKMSEQSPAQSHNRTQDKSSTQFYSSQRPSPPPPKASLDPESLFFPQYDDEDRRWGERNLDEEDTVGWSATALSHQRSENVQEQLPQSRLAPYQPYAGDVREVLEATQRVSEIDDAFGIGIG